MCVLTYLSFKQVARMMHYTSNEKRDRKSEELIECISLCASLTFLTIFYFSAQNKLELAFLTGHRSRSAFNEETYRWVKSKENGQSVHNPS